MAIVTETTYKHEATGVEATPTTLDGKPVIAVNAGDLCGDISRDEARALVEVLQAALGDAPEADSDGWIPWRGGKMPVEKGTLVVVRHRNGAISEAVPAGETVRGSRTFAKVWGHTGHPGDVIAYRIVKESK